MEEDIKILKRMLEIEKECLHYEVSKNEIQAIENILNRLEQLEKENKELKEQIYIHEIFPPSELELKLKDSIPKFVIRNKLEELKQESEKIKENEWLNRSTANTVKVKLLKEILGDE